MTSSNINDSSAIQALLDQLKASDAWQKVANASDTAPAERASASNPSDAVFTPSDSNASLGNAVGAHETSFSGTHDASQTRSGVRDSLTSLSGSSSNATSVASLLSQLQASASFSAAEGSFCTPSSSTAYEPPSSGTSNLPESGATLPNSAFPSSGIPHTPPQNLRTCTFQQALPHLARLSEDPEFLKALTAMGTEQAELERQLWNERRDIQQKHEERVKAARTRQVSVASIIGAGLTPYEADALTDSFRAELLKFDRQRVLPAWDGLVTKQQAALEALGVPAMFPSAQPSDRERQQSVMQVLGGIVGSQKS